MSFQWETAEEINKELANRVRNIRKRRKISQEELSQKSGVSYGSIKRFESTGMISLLSLTRIAMALGCTEEIKKIFTEIPYNSIEEVINENK
jgi:transcriptional regulator with XRE-family HTH domain